MISSLSVLSLVLLLLSSWHCNALLLPPLPARRNIFYASVGLDHEADVGNQDTLTQDDRFCLALRSHGISERHQERMLECLQQAEIFEEGCTLDNLCLLAQDFVSRPEVFSTLLVEDFCFPPLVAHQTRALVMSILKNKNETPDSKPVEEPRSQADEATEHLKAMQSFAPSLMATVPEEDKILIHNSIVANGDKHSNADNQVLPSKPDIPTTSSHLDTHSSETLQEGTKPVATLPQDRKGKGKHDISKDVDASKARKKKKVPIVNERAKRRRKNADNYEYALPADYKLRFPKLASEMDDFYTFMIQPTTSSQEPPIRAATADVYLKHAKLFLGWHVSSSKNNNNNNSNNNFDDASELSLYTIIANKQKDSAKQIIDFVLWLRGRDISVSYEANVLRGLTKLLKYRFAEESTSDPAYGGNTFDDIPVIKEVRKLHRDANKRQRLAPRSSDEQMKWLSWTEFLQVIQETKNELLGLIAEFQDLPVSERKYSKSDQEHIYCLQQKNIADAFQRYLILAIFASIPDRQRTIRELELGRTLVKDENKGCWVVKHGPDDYKTGKSYGERPPMQLSNELSPAIDAFLENWRPVLRPSTDFFFVQSKTGKPFTRDSVFQRVSNCCFKYTGKRTNPHLLRDMIVTHVRESDASEKELEALALFMGHSLNMQRSSYDRRTLENKIAPAVNLIQTVNGATTTSTRPSL